MPMLDGHDMLARMRMDERLKDVPVVVITALRNEDGRGELLLRKPFDFSDLSRVLEKALGERRRRA